MSTTQRFYNLFQETVSLGEKAALLFSMRDPTQSNIPAFPQHAVLPHFLPKTRTGLPNNGTERRIAHAHLGLLGFSFLFFLFSFIYLAVLGLSCSMRDLPSSLWHLGSLVVHVNFTSRNSVRSSQWILGKNFMLPAGGGKKNHCHCARTFVVSHKGCP